MTEERINIHNENENMNSLNQNEIDEEKNCSNIIKEEICEKKELIINENISKEENQKESVQRK